MFKCETESTELGLNYKPNRGKSSTFLKAGARNTILSVLSKKVKNQSAILRNKEKAKQIEILETDSKPQDTQNGNPKDNSMTSTCPLPSYDEGKSPVGNDGDGEVVNGDTRDKAVEMINGTSAMKETGSDSNSVHEKPSSISMKDQVVSKNFANTTSKPGRISKKAKTPFDYMKERKLSEPVLSPRKRANAMSSKMIKCRSTVDLRENEKPVVRELAGYKFYQKPGEPTSKDRRSNSYRSNSDSQTTGIAALKKTITEQTETIANREKYVLQLEKKICTLENENLKNKKRMATLRENNQDCLSTLDYLRHEKEVLASEKDRLNFTLLTSEDELKELRLTNVKLVTEYENAEQSRKIAVGHLQEMEKTTQGSREGAETFTNCPKFIEKLNAVKECAQRLRAEREALQDEQKRLSLFLTENVQMLLDHVREVEQKKDGAGSGLEILKQENVVEEEEEEEKGEKEGKGNKKENDDVFEQVEEGEDEKETDLVEFKEKLKANEEMIDQLANEIRSLENTKKGLLESRFNMIQGFQAGHEFIDGEDIEEEGEEDEEGVSDEEVEEKVEGIEERGKRKQSYRVTRKIRKLERTLSMNHGVGKLDCIQKLCKTLEDREQRIQELETTNKELQEEHDDMEEEAKYLKYVLSYRGDIMKAQLESEYQKKRQALEEEFRVAKKTSSGTSQQSNKELSERNRVLEDEVQRLHEELKSLLLNLPGLQGDDEQRSTCSCECDTSREIGYTDEVVKDLERKVVQLMDEKRVLLLSMQTLSAQREPCEHDSEHNASFSKSLLVLEKSLREVENENAHFLETFQRIREVLEVEDEERGSDEHVDSILISKLKDEIQKLSETTDTRRSMGREDSTRSKDSAGSCVRHEERLSELGKEVVRLHEEKKSLLSTIIRLQADPNFTFSDDVTDDDRGSSVGWSPGKDLVTGDEVDGTETFEPSLSASPQRENETASSPLPARSYREEEVQVSAPSEDLGGLVRYLERDLEKLKTALSQQSIVGYNGEELKATQSGKVPHSATQQDVPAEIQKLNQKVKELEEQIRVLQENLDESELIRSDLHRTISIATDMATEERQKCADLMQMKTALEKEMIKLTKNNHDLRDGLETLSRVRKRRNSRVQYMSPASEGGENDALYLPLLKRHTYSESDFSDIDSPTPESK